MSILKQYLKYSGETQDSFAKRINVSQAYVAKLCRENPKRPSIEIAGRIEAATKGAVPMQAWVGLKGDAA